MSGSWTVEVLLATYNGERFLREQLDSILMQDYPDVRVLASDDGSQDGTVEILSEYVDRLPTQFRVVNGLPPSGSAQANFLRLMHYSTAPYICFSDQDDVWLPHKISRGMRLMEELESRHGTAKPLMVFSDLTVVDSSLRTIHASMWAAAGIVPEAASRLRRLLPRAVVTGCTMMINRPMLELARQMPPEALMHDRWIALLAASLGGTGFIREPLVLYRQHEANVVGAVSRDLSPSGLIKRLRNKEGRATQRVLNELQVEALYRQHSSQMSGENAELLLIYLESSRNRSSAKRIWLTLRYGFLRQGLPANLALLLEPFREIRQR